MSFNNVTQIQKRNLARNKIVVPELQLKDPTFLKSNRIVFEKKSPRKGEKQFSQHARLSFAWDPSEFEVKKSPERTQRLSSVTEEPRETKPTRHVHEWINQSRVSLQKSSSSNVSTDMDDDMFNAQMDKYQKSQLGKRPSLTSLGQSEKHAGSNKKLRVEEPNPHAAEPEVDSTQFRKGDFVRVVKNAKLEYMNRVARVEKFLSTKGKWGLLIQGKRIALKARCLEFIKHGILRCKSKACRPRARRPCFRRVVSSPVKRQSHLHLHDHIERPLVRQASNGTVQTYQTRLTDESFFDYTMGLTPLSLLASRDGQDKIIKALVMSNKCDINDENGSFQNALHIACMHNQAKCALLLLEMGIETSSMDASKSTPLMYAAMNGMLEVVIALIQVGANIEHQNHEGYTALMLACQRGHSDCVDVLLEAGAHLKTENDHEANALMVALSGGHVKIAEKLMKLMTEKKSEIVRFGSPEIRELMN